MKGKNGQKMHYSSGQYLFETKRFINKKKLDHYAKINKIAELETNLKNLNSKTTNYLKYAEYVKEKNSLLTQTELYKIYENIIYRRLRWYAYINKQKA